LHPGFFCQKAPGRKRLERADFATGKHRNGIVKALTGEVWGAHLPFLSKRGSLGIPWARSEINKEHRVGTDVIGTTKNWYAQRGKVP